MQGSQSPPRQTLKRMDEITRFLDTPAHFMVYVASAATVIIVAIFYGKR